MSSVSHAFPHRCPPGGRSPPPSPCLARAQPLPGATCRRSPRAIGTSWPSMVLLARVLNMDRFNGGHRSQVPIRNQASFPRTSHGAVRRQTSVAPSTRSKARAPIRRITLNDQPPQPTARSGERPADHPPRRGRRCCSQRADSRVEEGVSSLASSLLHSESNRPRPVQSRGDPAVKGEISDRDPNLRDERYFANFDRRPRP